jgi:putative nucleotidyltransferase with HDIG domain
MMEEILWDAVEALVSAINHRVRNEQHSVRVAQYTLELARAAGYRGEELDKIRLGALLHDLGQIIYTDDLIAKQGEPLTDAQKDQIHAHPTTGVTYIEQWPSLAFAIPPILYHQEWGDGSGYPNGATRDLIPREVQLISLADVYEALRHDRPYYHRRGLSHAEAVKQMGELAGKRWDQDLFDMFIVVSAHWR